ncbi:MAG: ParA family protein [Hyphomicrobiaceae bacterium]
MFFGFEFLPPFVKELLVAAVGFIFKAWMDRRKFTELKSDFKQKLDEHEENAKSHYGDLALREAQLGESKERLVELQQVIDDRGAAVNLSEERLNRLLATLADGETGVWSSRPPLPPFDNYLNRTSRTPVKGATKPRPLIMTLVNYKGGVGKTTTTANLAGYFDLKLKKRVLMLDLDYQGSLTTVLKKAAKSIERDGRIAELFESGAGLAQLLVLAERLGNALPNSSFVRSFYEFAHVEERLMVQWLLERTHDDVRYRLARILLDDDLGKQFDVVLIDAPPRLTAGTINALCASTHVLVPTIMDSVSAEPVINFLRQTDSLMRVLNPSIKVVGVLETMAPPATWRARPRDVAILDVKEALKKSFPHITLMTTSIPRKPILTDGSLAYGTDRDVTTIFNHLGDEIVKRVGVLP